MHTTARSPPQSEPIVIDSRATTLPLGTNSRDQQVGRISVEQTMSSIRVGPWVDVRGRLSTTTGKIQIGMEVMVPMSCP